jgi:hypothetical protein
LGTRLSGETELRIGYLELRRGKWPEALADSSGAFDSRELVRAAATISPAAYANSRDWPMRRCRLPPSTRHRPP